MLLRGIRAVSVSPRANRYGKKIVNNSNNNFQIPKVKKLMYHSTTSTNKKLSAKQQKILESDPRIQGMMKERKVKEKHILKTDMNSERRVVYTSLNQIVDYSLPKTTWEDPKTLKFWTAPYRWLMGFAKTRLIHPIRTINFFEQKEIC
jgi:hypothetical protein